MATPWYCRPAGCSRCCRRSREHLPEVERVSSYCLPRNLRRKSVDELRELADAGLRMAYVGAESGDDEVLARVNKGETYSSTLMRWKSLARRGSVVR